MSHAVRGPVLGRCGSRRATHWWSWPLWCLLVSAGGVGVPVRGGVSGSRFVRGGSSRSGPSVSVRPSVRPSVRFAAYMRPGRDPAAGRSSSPPGVSSSRRRFFRARFSPVFEHFKKSAVCAPGRSRVRRVAGRSTTVPGRTRRTCRAAFYFSRRSAVRRCPGPAPPSHFDPRLFLVPALPCLLLPALLVPATYVARHYGARPVLDLPAPHCCAPYLRRRRRAPGSSRSGALLAFHFSPHYCVAATAAAAARCASRAVAYCPGVQTACTVPSSSISRTEYR